MTMNGLTRVMTSSSRKFEDGIVVTSVRRCDVNAVFECRNLKKKWRLERFLCGFESFRNLWRQKVSGPNARISTPAYDMVAVETYAAPPPMPQKHHERYGRLQRSSQSSCTIGGPVHGPIEGSQNLDVPLKVEETCRATRRLPDKRYGIRNLKYFGSRR
ncbi:Uncharacterised protein r2_g1192 [Pycnogonum litorale]